MTGRRGKKEESGSDIADIVKSAVLDAIENEDFILKLADALSGKVTKELQKAISKNANDIVDLQCRVDKAESSMSQQHEQLWSKTDDLEQYSRRNCLRIFGVPESRDENTDQLVVKVAKDIGVDLGLCDIDRSHRVGKKISNKHRAIICKFVSHNARQAIYSNKKKLKGSKVHIVEDLTKLRLDLYTKVVKKVGPQNAWTLDGNIYASSGGDKYKITSISDLDVIGV
jgi:exosome complex exonuclease DIS3/RRP44